jgi:general secretion pathway protein G
VRARTLWRSLAELAVIFAVLILAAAACARALLRVEQYDCRAAGAKAQVASFEYAIDQFKADTGRLPASLDELVHRPTDVVEWRGYLRKDVPLDPWGHPYFYEIEPGGEHSVLRSNGEDGVAGTADDIVRRL